MNAERLNELSTDALYALAEKMGVDLPHGLERVFVLELVLEAFDEDNADRRPSSEAASHVEEKKYSGSELDEIDASIDAAPCIARLYNETSIRLIARDAEWAFVFWDIRDEEMDAIKTSEGYSGLFLRVIKEGVRDSKNPASFDVPVGVGDIQWYLQLPEQDGWYRVDLCARLGSKVRLIAHSNAIRAPRSIMSESFSELDETTVALITLSGLDRLQIVQVPEHHPSRILDGFDV